MKKIFTKLSVLALTLVCGATAAFADNAYVDQNGIGHPSDNHSYDYFTWDWDFSTNQPAANAKGLALYNATDTEGTNVVTVHCKKDGDRYRFYCDPDCKIELIGYGYTNGWGGFGIVWQVVINGNYPDNSYRYMGGAADRSPLTSPRDLSEFFYMISNAYYAMKSQAIQLSSTTHPDNGLVITVVMHDTYVMKDSEWHKAVANFRPGDGRVDVVDYLSMSFCHDNSTNPATVVAPYYYALKRADDFVGSDADNAIISLEPEYSGGEDDPDTRYLNLSPGPIVIDNNTTNDSDVAVKVGHNALFMDIVAVITNSKSGYHGIGVKLAAAADGITPYHNASIELGSDQNGVGSSKIQNQRIGVDAYAGVIRLKCSSSSNPVNITDNTISASIAHEVMLGKWAADISSFTSTGSDVLITLKNPDEWRAGDIVFASGRTKVANSNPSPIAQEYFALLTESEGSHLKYAPETDLTNYYDIFFDQTGTPTSVDYEYPVFRLDVSSVHNTRTDKWYPNLYAALYDSSCPVADGDEIVYFGNVLEPKSVTVNNNITIRSASNNNADDVAIATALSRTVSASGYTSSYGGTSSTFITVASGKSLTIGGQALKDGSFTIDMQKKGRALDIYGTVSIYASYPSGIGLSTSTTICNGNVSGDGGAIKIESSGTLNIDNVIIDNNTATGNGAAIYQGGTMCVSGNLFFGETDYVYLPVSRVITKVGSLYNSYNPIPVKLANEVSGRDILVSKDGAADSNSGQVVSSDYSGISVARDNPLFAVVYNATGLDGAVYSPTDVIELFLGNGKILVIKEGLKTGDSAVFTVTAAGGANPSYTIVLTGIDNSGSQVQQAILEVPINTYTVTETDWSWAYQAVSGTNSSITKSIAESQAVGVFSEFRFTNEEKSNTSDHAESSANNEFN